MKSVKVPFVNNDSPRDQPHMMRVTEVPFLQISMISIVARLVCGPVACSGSSGEPSQALFSSGNFRGQKEIALTDFVICDSMIVSACRIQCHPGLQHCYCPDQYTLVY